MLDNDTMRCTANCCECKLTEDERTMTMELETHDRHAYECPCGAITITVERQR